jgi:hypothetical protein
MTIAEIIRIIGREPSSPANRRLVQRAIHRAEAKRNERQRVPVMLSRDDIVAALKKHAPPAPPDPLA